MQQYGQSPAQPYGGQPPQYGQPLTPGQVIPPPDIKWSGLSKGGAFRVPVIAFIGRLTDMVFDTQAQFGLRIVEKYDQVQILESPVPWPWATIDVPVTYKDSQNSAWGRHVESAKAIGIAVNAASLDQAKAELIGKTYEMHQIHESFGEDKEGKTIAGDIWKFVRVLATGGQQPQYAPPMATPQPQPQPQAPEATTGFDATPSPTDTAPVRAKKLLHGKALNEWLGVALLDPVIKADASFVNSIFDQSFIVGLRASHQVVLGANGKFQVVA